MELGDTSFLSRHLRNYTELEFAFGYTTLMNWEKLEMAGYSCTKAILQNCVKHVCSFARKKEVSG